MEKVAIEEVETGGMGDADVRRLADPLGTSDVAINHYTLDPGERFSGGLHTHMDQEEVFYVLEGEATFETPDDQVTVGAGALIRFAPGEYQSGKNAGDEPVRALALGAPKESEDVRVPETCHDCGHENMRFIPGDDGFTLVCPECGTEVDA
jgi:uncharacterized cupin superfamily protein